MNRRAIIKALRRVLTESGKDAARGGAVGGALSGAFASADEGGDGRGWERTMRAVAGGALVGSVGGRVARQAVIAPKRAYTDSMRALSARANRKLNTLSADRYPKKPYSQWTQEERAKLYSGGYD